MSASEIQATPKLWTKEDLAAYLEVPTSWIWNRTKSKPAQGDRIPHLKLGRLLRFDPADADFQRWLDGHRHGV